jgi:hypothetical protein
VQHTLDGRRLRRLEGPTRTAFAPVLARTGCYLSYWFWNKYEK